MTMTKKLHSFFLCIVIGVIVLFATRLLKAEISDSDKTNRLKIVTFQVDVTPPIGEQLAYVINKGVDSPIYVSGIILDDGKTRAVWVSCDYLYICGEIHVLWTDEIARHAGVPRENVFLHSVHLHDTMFMAPGYNPKEGEDSRMVVNPEYCEKSLKDVSEAIAKAVAGPWQPVGKLLTAETRIGGLASSRRIHDETGRMRPRLSGVQPPDVQALTVGNIDPILRTVCFENTEGQRVVALHFYATHPMGAYLPMVSTNVPGRALRLVKENEPSVARNIYFSGCGADIAFGKYNLTGDLQSIERLGKRLGEGMLQNLRRLEEQPIGSLVVKRVAFDVPFLDSIPPASECPDQRAPERRYFLETIDLWRKSSVARMSIGPRVHFLSFEPGEIFVDYQLYAQSLIPEHFLATAAFGNGVYLYIPTRAAIEENAGYETSSGECLVKPEIDEAIRNAIRQCFDEVINDPLFNLP